MDVESFFDSTAFDADNFLPSTLSSNFDDDVGTHADYLNGAGSFADPDTTFMPSLHPLDTPGSDAESLQFRQFASGGARETSAKPARREVSASAQDRISHSRTYAQQRRNRQHSAQIHHSASPHMQAHSQLFAQHMQRQHSALAPRVSGLSAGDSSDFIFDSPGLGNGRGRVRLPSSPGASGAEASLGKASPGQSHSLEGRQSGGRRGNVSSSDVSRIECKPGKLGISIAYDGESKTAAIDFVQACSWQPDVARKARPGQIIVRIGNWDAVGRSSALITSKLSDLQTIGGMLVVWSPDGMSQTDTALGSALPRSVSGSSATGAATTSSISSSETSEQRRTHQRPQSTHGDLYSSGVVPPGYFAHMNQLGLSGPRPGAGAGGHGLASVLGASGSVQNTGIPPHLYASAQSALNFTISAVVHAPSPAAGDAANSDEAAGEKGSKQAGGKISRKVYNKKRLREISDFIDTLRGVATPYGFRMQCKRDVLRATVSLVNQLQQQNALLHDVLGSIVRPGDPSSLASHAGGLGHSAAFASGGLVSSSGEQPSTGEKDAGQRASDTPGRVPAAPTKRNASRRGTRAGGPKATSTAVTAQGTSSAVQNAVKRKNLPVNKLSPPKKKPGAKAN